MAGDLVDLSALLPDKEMYKDENDWFYTATFDISFISWEKDAQGFYLFVCLINPEK